MEEKQEALCTNCRKIQPYIRDTNKLHRKINGTDVSYDWTFTTCAICDELVWVPDVVAENQNNMIKACVEKGVMGPDD